MAESPTDIQIRVAAALSVYIARDSRGVVAARFYDAVAEAIGERHGCRSATARQVEFAQGLNLDVRGDTVRVASAKIADELDRRNRKALIALQLQPGDRVLTRKAYEIDGQRHELAREFTVSSIDARGRLHFRVAMEMARGQLRLKGWPSQRAANFTLERPAGSPSLAEAAHRDR